MTQKWTFQRKVTAGFAVMVGLAVVIAVVSIFAAVTVASGFDRVVSVQARGLAESTRLTAAAARQVAAFRMFLLFPEERFLQQRNAGSQEFLEALGRLDKLVITDESKRMLAAIRQRNAEALESQDRGIALRQSKGQEVAVRFDLAETYSLRQRLEQECTAFVNREERLLDEAKRESSRRTSVVIAVVTCLGVVAVLFAAVIAFLLRRTLSQQVGAAVQHVQSSSAELQAASTQQATGAREASTAMNEVSTTMSELLVTSRQIAESAQQVAHIAEDTAQAATAGDLTVAKTQDSIAAIRQQVDVIVSHMLDLGKKSQQIGVIVDVINELSEQTNILSINATIEAAGAGEAGKRFAVVGDEIRKLAERVTGFTKDIRGLVDEIRGAVNTTVLATEGGSKAVDAGLQHFQEVTRGFKQIAGMVATTTQAAREIELSTKQQTTAVEQVNAAITGAAQATRETETSSGLTLQTATQLANLSHELSRIVQPHAVA
jgi:methyl-accepting chemotaxis protein